MGPNYNFFIKIKEASYNKIRPSAKLPCLIGTFAKRCPKLKKNIAHNLQNCLQIYRIYVGHKDQLKVEHKNTLFT